MIRIDPLFPALCAVTLAVGWGAEFLLLMVSAGAHEAAHGLIAAMCGLKPCAVEISPIGLAVELPRIELLSFKKKISIYSAGPAINLALLISARVCGSEMLFIINSALFLFNLLPARTLDGGRILSAFLAMRMGYMRSLRTIRLCGKAVFGLVFILGVAQAVLFPYNLSLLCLAPFLKRQCEIQSAADSFSFMRDIVYTARKYVLNRKYTVKAAAFPEDAPAKTLFDLLNYDAIWFFYLYSPEGRVTVLTEEELITGIKDLGMTAPAISSCPMTETRNPEPG
ncbi:MAG: site-2 protease family protein [Clostridiales bacterium]|jgi:Zn-dependent protease|nr:site-2 protease family protein [Clostridiales bacterium]